MHFDRPIYTSLLTLKQTHAHVHRDDTIQARIYTCRHACTQVRSHVYTNIYANIHPRCPFIQMIPSDVVGKHLPRIVLVIMFIRFCACVMTNMIALKTSLAVVCAPRLITLGLMKWEIKVHLATRSYLLIHVVQKLMSNALPSSALANLKAFQP